MKKKIKETTMVKQEPAVKSLEIETVGDIINLLNQFPQNARIAIRGNMEINNDSYVANLKPEPTIHECDCCVDDEDKCHFDEKCDDVMKQYLFGVGYKEPEIIEIERSIAAETLMEIPVMQPNKTQLEYEYDNLKPEQCMCLDEIRRHNAFIAESMSELYRRQLSALLEYNTQCMAHFGVETNKVMCRTVKDASSTILDCIEDIMCGDDK